MYRQRKTPNGEYQYIAISLTLFAVLLTVCGLNNNVLGSTILLDLDFANNSFQNTSKSNIRWKQLFLSPKSIGNLAIGHAEGNYTVDGERTSLYLGHTDPGNGVWNSGFCSDQGRGQRLYNKLNNLNKLSPGVSKFDLADKECIRYISQDLELIDQNMRRWGLEPQQNIEVLINAVDLRNQASPDTHPRFVYRYAQALKDNSIKDKIVWARVMAFRKNRWTATGLLGICRRENRPVSNYGCIEMDQKRRANAIRSVLKNKGII